MSEERYQVPRDRLTALFPGPSEVAALMRRTDWSATPLGDPETWPQNLRTMVSLMLTSRHQMCMAWGPDLRFFYNDAYRPTLGAKHPHSLAAPMRELWAEVWEDIGPRMQRVLRTGEATWDEGLLLLLERNGYPEETYHTFSWSPIFGDAGTVDGMFCGVTEETERVISERRLALVRELSSRLAMAKTTEDVAQAVQEAWPVASRDLPFTLMYLFDTQGLARLVAQTGIPPGHPAAAAEIDVHDSRIWPLGGMLDRPESLVLESLPSVPDWPSGPWSRPPTAAVLTPIARQGQERPAGVFITGVNPHRPCDSGYRSFLSLFVGQIAAGLSNVRAYEAERQRAESLAEIDRAKTAFFSNVSHELRTPLTLMLGPLEDLGSREDIDAQAMRQLAMVRRNGARLLRHVNTLLDFSRIEAGRAQAHYEPVDLSRCTREVASVFASAIERAGLKFTVECPAFDEPVYIDRQMWEKIVLNLVSNAFKYTLVGEISVSTATRGDRALLTVRDTGVGIAASELPRVFERFHRVAGARGRSHEGSGIGLALAQELVKLHGGSIEVESEPGHGSTFVVAVPLGRDHLPGDQVHEPAGLPQPTGANLFVEEALQWLPESAEDSDTAGQPLPETPVDGELPLILIVDDSADMRSYVSRLLKSRWRVAAVANGRAALAAIAGERPQLVISDLMMPDFDGFELIQALRRDAHTRDIPVLFLTARAGDEARLEALEAGASDYLVKPFSARELLARVEAQLLQAKVRAVEEAHARRLESVFAHAPVAIAILRGPEHVFELANEPYLRLLNYRDVIGKPLREAIPEVESQGIPELLDGVYRSGEPHVGRALPLLVNLRPEGPPQQRYFDFVYQPLLDETGDCEGIAAVAYDVTELAQARKDAEIASSAKDEFLAMLGHELRNPLAPIMTALELLRLRGVEGGGRERDVIERQVKHLVALVNDLLDVSRITRGKVQLKREPFELSEALTRAVETASPLFEQKHQRVRIDVPGDGLAVKGDLNRMAQVIANLLTNAAKYTQRGGQITVTGFADGSDAVLSVRDTGIGIDSAMLPRIFDMFVQERQALDRAQGGLGLGLTIVRSLVELHGGRAEVHSEGPGKGAEFSVRLPRLAVNAAAGLQPDTADAPAAAAGTRALRILVVDDNADAALMLADVLGSHGHVVRTAGDAPSALREAEAFLPEVALLDIGLPVMNGYELARRLRENPALADTRLVAVTGYGQARDRRRSAAAGFVAHLVKPVELEELREILDPLANVQR